MKMFRIYQADDYGRPVYYWGVFEASDEKEARAKAAEYYDNEEIASTGFYDAKEVTQEEIDDMIEYHRNEINKLTVLG